MPQPNATNPLTIVISQRSSDGLFFQEKYVSGSNLRLETDINGNIVGVPGGGASGKFTGSFSGSAQLTSLTASAIRIIGQPRPLVFANDSSQTISKNGGGDLSIVNNVSGGKVYVENSYFLEDDLVVPGDIAVNGGDITTTSTGTATVFNTNATTLNVGGAATTVSIGAATGTTTINNANTVVTGDLAVNGGDITTTSTGTATVFNTNATTLNVGGAATTVSIGAGTGTTTINNANTVVTGDLAVNGGDITTNQTNFNLVTAASGQITIGGATSKVYIPGTLRASVISESIIHITSSQVDIGDNIIRVNALYPFKQYAGLEAIDSGSLPRVTASILWNSETNTWFINHKNSGKVTSSYVIVGPKSTNFGNPVSLNPNAIVKGTPGGLGNEITSSFLTDDGTTLTYTGIGGISLTKITGSSLRINGTSVFNGQVTASSTRITGPAVLIGNTTIGDATSDTLTVGATSNFTGPITASSVRVTGPVVMIGNTTIGDATSDTLTVGATSNFTGPLTASNGRFTGTFDVIGQADFFGNVTIGDASSDTLTVNATSTFTAPVTFTRLTGSISGSNARFGQLTGSGLRITGPAVMVGNTRIGDAISDTLTVTATSTFNSPITASSARVTGIVAMVGNTTIGDASSDTLTVNATSTFTAPATFTQISGSLSGSIAVAGINRNNTYYATFVKATSGSQTIFTDPSALTYNPSTNVFAIGTSVSGSLTIGSKLTMQDLGGSSQLRVGINTTDTSSFLVSGNAFTVVKGTGVSDKVSTTLPVTMSNNVLIGDASSDTLTVYATSKFNAPATFTQITGSISGSRARFGQLTGSSLRTTGTVDFTGNGTVILGSLIDNPNKVFINNAKTTFNNNFTASSIRVTGPSLFVGNTIIGDASTDTLTVGANTTFTGPVSASLISSSFRSNNFVFNDLKGNISTYVAGGSTNGRIPSSSLDRTITGPVGLTLVTGSLRVDDQFLYVFTGLYWKRVSLSAFNI